MSHLIQFLRLSHVLILLLFISVGTVIVAEINTSIDKLQGRNKNSVTDEIRQQLEAQSAPEGNTKKNQQRPEAFLGINTADVREDTSSVQFLDLFKSSIPFEETVPWGSSKGVEYDKNGWPTDLKGGQAGTKFLNRLPHDTIEDGFFTVLYDGEGNIFYGNDARLIVHRPNKDIIEIKAGKDKILNASLFIKESNPDNYIRNIRILPEGGICEGAPHVRVKSELDCGKSTYLSFEDNHLNPLADAQRNHRLEDNIAEKLSGEKSILKKQTKSASTEKNSDKKDKTEISEKIITSKDDSSETNDTTEIDTTKKQASKEKENKKPDNQKPEIKGFSDVSKAIVFNPEYLEFMKDFQVVRFMNMSGMTRNPVEKWEDRNTLEKASWGGKYGSRGAPVEIMVALSNQLKADPWFSMPYKANNDYIEAFGKYVSKHLHKELKAYIEYSNEVWNPIFIHHDYAIAEGMKKKLDKKKSIAGYKWYSLRSVETFKIWEKVFNGADRLVRVMGSWASNQTMSSTVLSYNDAYKHTDAVAIGPYFSAHPRVLRRAKTVDDVFKAMLDKNTKWGMHSTVNYIKKQANVAQSFGVDLVAYEGGQHLVDWNTRNVDEHPNKLLYAANRDPRMGILYDELMEEWQRQGGKLFVAFSAPRIYSWYGSWGVKEHIRQPRSEAPKYDSLLRYLNARLYPEKQQDALADSSMKSLSGETAEIPVIYAKTPNDIWNMSSPHKIRSTLQDNSQRDISASWQASWDTKHLYISLAVNDDDLQSGDAVTLTLDTTTEEQIKAKKVAQDKIDIETEKKLLAKKKKEQTARKKIYEARAIKQAKEEAEKEKKKAVKLEKEATEGTDKEEQTNTSEKSTEHKEYSDTKDKNKKTITASSKDITDTKDKGESQTSADKKASDSTSSSTTDKVKTKAKDMATDKVKETEKDSKIATREAKENPKENSSIMKTENNDDNKTKETNKLVPKGEDKKSDSSKSTKTDEVNSDSKDKSKDNVKESTEMKDKKEKEQTEKESDKASDTKTLKVTTTENATSFYFTPFDQASTQARTIRTDSGYLLNLAIPWQQIYSYQETSDNTDEDSAPNKKLPEVNNVETIQVKPGDKLGINLIITDADSNERGSKELRSADTNLPLPKIVLKNTLSHESSKAN